MFSQYKKGGDFDFSHILRIKSPRLRLGLFIAAKCVKSQNHPPFYTMKRNCSYVSRGDQNKTRKVPEATCDPCLASGLSSFQALSSAANHSTIPPWTKCVLSARFSCNNWTKGFQIGLPIPVLVKSLIPVHCRLPITDYGLLCKQISEPLLVQLALQSFW